MNLQQRLSFLKEQERAYIQGTVEYVNDEWVFFEDESEEASPLEETIGEEIEVFRFGKWINGTLCGSGTILVSARLFPLKDGDIVRFRKQLPYAYEQWLQCLPEQTFFPFADWLNDLGFSLYDCLYCYNQLLFSKNEGVNFIIYDNTKLIGNMQHHYERGEFHKDRFEITFNTGKRFICTQIS